MLDFKKILKEVKGFVYEKGALLKKYYLGRFKDSNIGKLKDLESRNSIVTKYDNEIELSFFEIFSKRYPEIGFCFEENTDLNDLHKEYVWYIDPIDGTRYFADGVIPLFGILIGLMKDEDPKLGLQYNPIINQMYAGCEDVHSNLNGKKVFVSGTKRLDQTVLAFNFSPHKSNWRNEGDWMLDKLNMLIERSYRIRHFASATETGWVASGVIDAVINLSGNVSQAPYEAAAHKGIIKYAGGEYVDLQVPGLSSPRFVAGNRYIVEQISKILLN